MAQILIRGSEGFIGSNIVSHFIGLGHNVIGCDLLEGIDKGYKYFKVSRLSPELEDIFNYCKFDLCINAAGNGNVPYSVEHPFNDFEANALDTIRILDIIRRMNRECRYLHISSAAVYGNPKALPIKEDDERNPISPYGWHKVIAENLCKEYAVVYDVSTAIIRPFSVYGPGLRKQLFWDLYQKLKHANGSIELWGTGNESRDFVYVTDVALCCELIFKHSAMKGDIYNVAAGVETTISEVVSLFYKNLEPLVDYHFNNKVRIGDPLNWRASIEKMKTIGYSPRIDIATGISSLCEWIKSLN
jgi:UDP-glucose 4-epimerase